MYSYHNHNPNTNRGVVENYASGHKSNCHDGCDGHNSTHSLYYKGDVLYSYGYHYPLAIRVNDGLYLINGSGYSVTTSAHTSSAYSAIYPNETIKTPTQAMKYYAEGNVSLFKKLATQWHEEKIETSKGKLSRARKEWSKNMHQRDIEESERAIKAIKSIYMN